MSALAVTVDAIMSGAGTETRVVEIGGVPIALHTRSLAFAHMVEERYAGFVKSRGVEETSGIEFEIELIAGDKAAGHEAAGTGTSGDWDDDEPEPADDLEVNCDNGIWQMRRGDFLAHWDSRSGRGQIRQAANPYSLDSVLRIVHSLVLARRGEFLVHAASAIRNGRAFLFAGVSGAGKTTISRLAPPDATLLTDEISYVRKSAMGYVAYGTPFAGELARVGENCCAPLQAVYLLRQGVENRIDEVPRSLAAQALMRNILFFAKDDDLVQCVFDGACEFVERVPVQQLTFRKDASVWELIG